MVDSFGRTESGLPLCLHFLLRNEYCVIRMESFDGITGFTVRFSSCFESPRGSFYDATLYILKQRVEAAKERRERKK